MKSKAPLALMEQAIMILVFALAAALCLRAFALSDRISRQNEARDQAVLQAESAAEVLKQVRGDFPRAAGILGGVWEDGVWSISYGPDWQITSDASAYCLQALPQDSGSPLLGEAQIRVEDSEDILFTLNVCWQKEGGNE